MHTDSIRRGVRSPLALALLACALPSTSALAQDAASGAGLPTRPALGRAAPEPSREGHDVPADLQAAADSSSDTVLYAQTGDGAIWVRGQAYKARFGGDGATIVPFFGSDAPRNYPLELRVSSATLGPDSLACATDGAVSRQGATLRIDRGTFVEEYGVTTESLEQRFVFEELPSDVSGDLVVRMDVATELAGSDLGLALRFENELGSVDYGAAFAIDADGRRIDLDSTLADGRLELRVPAGFVETATLPLVIDPVITIATVNSSGLHDIYPDVSYDVTTDRWCVVWASIWSQSDHDAYARLATGAFQLLPGFITLDFTADTWTTPKVANNNFSNKFLACFAVVPVATGVAEIAGRFIDPAAGTAGNPFPISPADGAYRNWPDVGGDPYDGPFSHFLVVWQRSVSASNVDIEARLIAHDGTLGGVIPLESSPELHLSPTLSNSCGADDNSEAWWTVAWHHQVTPSDRDIYAAQVRWSGNVISPKFPVSLGNFDDTNPAVSTILDPAVSGAPRPYVIAYERNFGDLDVMAEVLSGSTKLGTTNLVGDYPSSRWYHHQWFPAVDSDGDKFLIGFEERATLSSTNHDVIVRSYFWDGQKLAAAESPMLIGQTSDSETDPAIHSMASSGGPRRDYLAAYAAHSSANGYDIVGALCRNPASQIESVCTTDNVGVNCPCGNDGAYGHGCGNSAHADGGRLRFDGIPSVGNDLGTLDAALLPPNVACLFFQGTTLTSYVPFGNGLRCVSGATIRLGLVACDSGGFASYPQPGQVPIHVKGLVSQAGTTTYYQAWYRDPSASACGSTFNVTNALRVIWEP